MFGILPTSINEFAETIANSIPITEDLPSSSIDILPSPDVPHEPKSPFELAIINAFKQTTLSSIHTNLTTAYSHINSYLQSIRESNGTKHILNKNLLDKLSRLTHRNYFTITILIAKIYESILDTSNFPYLSHDIAILISFSNEILNVLDIVKSTNINNRLSNKILCFLTYLTKTSPLQLEDDQKESIQSLIDSLPTRNNSLSYKNFHNIKDKILSLCKDNDIKYKLQGLNMIIDAFANVCSIEEQFDLLFEYCPALIKALLLNASDKYIDVYFQLGNFILGLLYNYKYVAIVDDDNVNNDEHIQTNKVRAYFITEPPFANIPMKENVYTSLSFLHNVQFELVYYKDILLQSENIFTICNTITQTLLSFNHEFNMQYICFLILKRIYFIFPQFRNEITSSLCTNIMNICSFVNSVRHSEITETKQFLHYILNSSSSDNNNNNIKHELQKQIESKGSNIDINLNSEYIINDVDNEKIHFNNFNLRIGYPNCNNIEAGTQYEKYIEVDYPNSLVYIGFTTDAYDITCHILKYVQGGVIVHDDVMDEDLTDKGRFVEIFTLERVNCSETAVKVVMFVRDSGIYKLVFDNNYSWFTSKTVRYRVNVLKAESAVDIERGRKEAKDEEELLTQNEKMKLLALTQQNAQSEGKDMIEMKETKVDIEQGLNNV